MPWRSRRSRPRSRGRARRRPRRGGPRRPRGSWDRRSNGDCRTGECLTLTPCEASTKPLVPGWILGLRLPGRTSGNQPPSSSRPTDTNTSACWIAFIRLGLAGTKCGSSYPRQRLWAVTCFPPTNWATEARSVNDVATLRSAHAVVANSGPTANANTYGISDFMKSSRMGNFLCSCVGRCTSRRVLNTREPGGSRSCSSSGS